MVKHLRYRGFVLYQCELCEMGYIELETAERCEDYCNSHNSCSLEITKKAVFKPETELMPNSSLV